MQLTFSLFPRVFPSLYRVRVATIQRQTKVVRFVTAWKSVIITKYTETVGPTFIAVSYEPCHYAKTNHYK